MLKPELFLNERLSDLEWPIRFFYLGLYALADRDGVVIGTPKSLKARLLPYDDGNAQTILDTLETEGFITREDTTITLTGVVKKIRGRRPKKEEMPTQKLEF